jgi:hypothetical protein
MICLTRLLRYSGVEFLLRQVASRSILGLLSTLKTRFEVARRSACASIGISGRVRLLTVAGTFAFLGKFTDYHVWIGVVDMM